MIKISLILISMFLTFALQAQELLFNTISPIKVAEIPELLEATDDQIREEPQFGRASTAFAEQHGGPLTQAVLRELRKYLTPEEYAHLRLVVKTHELEKGWYPNEPGWHCNHFYYIQEGTNDDNSAKTRIRPINPLDVQTRIFIAMSGEPTTQFLKNRDVSLDLTLPNWRVVAKEINKSLQPEDIVRLKPGTLTEFRCNEIHQGSPAKKKGMTWRYMLRATWFPEGHEENEIGYENNVRHRQNAYPPEIGLELESSSYSPSDSHIRSK